MCVCVRERERETEREYNTSNLPTIQSAGLVTPSLPVGRGYA